MKKFISKNKFSIFAWTLFIITRLLILKFPPLYYSDVSHDYERYANMWWYGLAPYLEHYYEYPPATIPLLVIPLWMDLSGFGKYYFNYRLIIFSLEFFIFATILKLIKNQKTSFKKYAVIFYCLVGLIAKDFWYEGLDLVFVGSLLISIYYLLKSTKIKSRITTWFFFWLSFGIKFMTLPLFPVFFASLKEKFKKRLLPIVIGLLLVWGVPLAIFRSSLMVSVVFHLNRAAKYGSFQSHIADFANHFTHTETRVNQPPDFQLTGPVSQNLENIFQPIFYLGIIIIVAISFFKLTKLKKVNLKSILRYSLIYILFIFLAGKTFSSPFHIWLVPLLAVFPFKNSKQQLIAFLLSTYMIILDTTGWIKFSTDPVFGPVSLSLLRDSTRFIPMFILLVFFAKNRNHKTR